MQFVQSGVFFLVQLKAVRQHKVACRTCELRRTHCCYEEESCRGEYLLMRVLMRDFYMNCFLMLFLQWLVISLNSLIFFFFLPCTYLHIFQRAGTLHLFDFVGNMVSFWVTASCWSCWGKVWISKTWEVMEQPRKTVFIIIFTPLSLLISSKKWIWKKMS